MLSRVAESIFWMCRFIERAENIARFINVNWHLELDSAASQRAQWEPLIAITADQELFAQRYDEYNRDNVIAFLAFDRDYPNSIISCLRAARENARSIREIISTDMWEQVNTFHLMVEYAAVSGQAMYSPYEFFRNIVKESSQFIGLTISTMNHDEGWHFCRAGRLLERADKTSRILDVKYFYLLPSVNEVGSPLDSLQWAALLRSASALQTYRQRFGQIDPKNVVRMLLLDREFPRSVRYCVDRAQDSLHAISGNPIGGYANEAERGIGQLAAELAYAGVDEILGTGLHEFIDRLQARLNDAGGALHETFFALHAVRGAVAPPALENNRL